MASTATLTEKGVVLGPTSEKVQPFIHELSISDIVMIAIHAITEIKCHVHEKNRYLIFVLCKMSVKDKNLHLNGRFYTLAKYILAKETSTAVAYHVTCHSIEQIQ